ncbi:hypothetical protein DCAR_0417586 [Daucus carota subsp. sativus]|uniref:Exostosin GT47 domain-containing protein n=1 Tax=Daucus carota subsp. sativus TaxID=79200 RepID=A0AAF0X213_DAUCS|nr:hypothetical protein DCAR_0417586 [Daucus carota subsp. sativus]
MHSHLSATEATRHYALRRPHSFFRPPENHHLNRRHDPSSNFTDTKIKTQKNKHMQITSIASSTNTCINLNSPYHNWELFAADYQEMQQNFKIFVYPDAYNTSSPFAKIFVPYPKSSLFNPSSRSKIGNYYSEHAFKAALLQSSLITTRPESAHFFYMPFSINAMRYDPRLHSEKAIGNFVGEYVRRISHEFEYWNASGGADHFYSYCHSVGREAASRHRGLSNNAIQVTCSSSYFQRFFVAHKDVGLPQVWPRQVHDHESTNARYLPKLVFFAGRIQNSRIRQEVVALWSNDTSMDIYPGNAPYAYEEGFKHSKYCLHLKGYEVNAARISDAIHYGCIPVLFSNYYDLPFANVLDWSKFSIIMNEADIVSLKKVLLSVPSETYESMYQNLKLVRRHFRWHETPRSYDSFYMTAYQLWLRRGLQRLPY